ncbi:hypothetical protein QGN23_10795 [Chryseobacterium gotjawalense]|uniref:NTF2-like N-terminal transpeptidase n=1 Tax=Chryseobacterium gotjawalense TaxID=3042315 RepID=A0ABY8RCM5_9FLAO|nr:hypothetical protein [Chryseobacterium sp. wdc7]WHF50913.1 hypothetical protein QGN23_10795 [Chryseobacterium sp. wdc7]
MSKNRTKDTTGKTSFFKISRFFVFAVLLFFVSCKKDAVDATTTQTLQSSINDMASGLNTLQQVKFNEALYILKTFGVEAEGEANELKALGVLINGKKVPEIFSLADQVAQKNGVEWSSTGPPSLGNMNIFGNDQAKEFDANDIQASSLSVDVNSMGNDAVLGPQSLQVVPRLLDAKGQPIVFEGAALEVILEVSSGGNRISTAKNLMLDNNFKGFNVRFASLPGQKIIDQSVDITVTVKTTKKTFKMSKIGVPVNPKALLMPAGNPADNPANEVIEDQVITPDASGVIPETKVPAADPKASVSKFLNNLSAQNLRGAYDVADNPNWGSYETFSNPTSGFGGVKSITVKNMTTNNASANAASVNATYDITDKEGRTTAVQVTFGLKNVNGDWKISSYKIN